jgi:hypothetical protein
MLAPTASESVSLSGSLDGTREPKSKIEFVAQKLAPYREQIAELQKTMRPWREFFTVRVPQESGEALIKKIQSNLTLYQTNYVAVSLCLTLLLLLRSPTALIAFSLLAVVWSFFLTKNDDITWKPVVFGTELSKQQRVFLMYAVSAVVFFLFALDILFSVVGLSLLIALVHAAVSQGQPQQVDPAMDQI